MVVVTVILHKLITIACKHVQFAALGKIAIHIRRVRKTKNTYLCARMISSSIT